MPHCVSGFLNAGIMVSGAPDSGCNWSRYIQSLMKKGKEHLKYRVESDEFYAIELLGIGKVIGNIYCGNRDYDTIEVGYIVNKLYQGKGYASEALSAVIENAFKEGAHRVYAECDPRNTPSWKLLEKVRLEREAHFKQNIWFHKDKSGKPIWKDTYVYATTESEWGSIKH